MKIFPGLTVITCPKCAAVWPLTRVDGATATPLQVAAANYVLGHPGGAEALEAAAIAAALARNIEQFNRLNDERDAALQALRDLRTQLGLADTTPTP